MLKTADTEMIFVVACDMPFISKDLIIKIVEIARENDWTTTIPYSKKGIEPLFGLYNKNILGHIEEALKNGHLSINKVLKKSQVKLVELSIDELNFLININTPSDLIKTEMALVSTL
ncbi:MAG: putative molybdenum cofactor guanylyltransferase [Syntrophomonadaceae bacterium]|nr:putative molybdenum cofactor guanylyltransferase [Bacillota bacterium]